MKDFTPLIDDTRTLEAEAKMLASIDKICRAKQQMKRFTSGSLYSITQKKKVKYRSTLQK